MAVQNSTAASDGLTERTRGVQATRTRSNETYRAEDAHSAGMAENGEDFESTKYRLTTIRQTS